MNSGLNFKEKTFPFFVVLLLMFGKSTAQTGRFEQELSGDNWSLWLDHGAIWADDRIHLPPVDVKTLPANPPTCGWEGLRRNGSALKVAVPGTVEEHYWGSIGEAVKDTAGNYVGVSWWSRKFHLDNALKGKRITLAFQSVNLRAEVFINGKLVGYDVVGNTPFEVDASEAVVFGGNNDLDIRITDPVGNFSWDDNILMRWGENLVPAVHGFGGITGNIILRATDPVVVSDIYVQNQPNPKKINIYSSLENYSEREQRGRLEFRIHEKGNPNAILWEKSVSAVVPLSGKTFSISAHVPKAELWELSEYKEEKIAKLYEASVRFIDDNGTMEDATTQSFGFRWFDIGEKNGDKRFYLNGKRVFVKAAMTRGFWPKNGIFPTEEMAKRDMDAMIDLGMNTMLMHRAIGQPGVFDYADKHGFFTYEEPGGYRVTPNRRENIDGPDEQALKWRKEKLRRMVIRDRSFPSMTIYNLKNEERTLPTKEDIEDMKMVHDLDPSRIITYNSGSDLANGNTKDYYDAFKTHDPMNLMIAPFKPTLDYNGWWDHHHWFGYSGYVDEMYRNPKFYLRGVVNSSREPMPTDSLYPLNKKKLIFFGEEGAFGTMVRLQKIKEEIGDKSNATGFRELEHLDWFDHYDVFLDQTGFRKAYPNVDSLTMSLGRNMHYFQGRNLENVRMGNIADGYNFNGWASASTRTDLVDMYRNPTADSKILHYYSRPLYIAIKLRNKVVQVGKAPITDFYIINEKGLKGRHILKVTLKDDKGSILFDKSFNVNIKGGEEFGQLLVENIKLPAIEESGYHRLEAKLEGGGTVKANGFDEMFTVDPKDRIPGTVSCAVLENSGTIKDFLGGFGGINTSSYVLNGPLTDAIIVGDYDFDEIGDAQLRDIMDRVVKGTRLIVLENADKFAQQINEILKNRPKIYKGGGIVQWGGSGRLFVGNSSVLTGLPQAQGMGWEYQCFYKGPKMGDRAQVSGIRLDNMGGEWIVGLGNQGSKEILSALSRIPVGQGSVTLSTLNMLPNLKEGGESAVVAKKLFINLLDY